ncbi:sulfate adenylyltransferase subunit 1 [Pectinatus brassicae]|uniref:sulfate adenylyltransferase n=1 Tax=Pectinatus brassicae TaxID=862415 RepID=A0A840UK30_9FIRM|nr:GTP-binding protein [Pectinatus brassicae]MBB5337496.1 sulfate adenylyltransferase subunit 1 [Pectinatus brassicae]
MSGLLKFITCGSVDDGKSTLIGHILYDSKLLYADQEKALELESKAGSRGGKLDYSLLLDGLMAEHEQGITIDVAYRYFTTDKRSFIVADTPGHEEYTRNMAVGASFADLAVILVDASKGVLVQTRRHARISHLMGIKNFVFAVNKMDIIDYDENKFNQIEEQINELVAQIGLENTAIIPLSATEGDNVTHLSADMPWYKGKTLLDFLETVEINDDNADNAFYLPVQRVCRPDRTFRGFQGQCESGKLTIGDEITVLPSGEKAKVKSIYASGKSVGQAIAGQALTVELDKEIDVSRGCVLTRDIKVQIGKTFSSEILWMDDEPLVLNEEYILQVGTNSIVASIEKINYKTDVNSGEKVKVSSLHKNELADCTIKLANISTLAKFKDYQALGSFILVNRVSNMTSACGVIRNIDAINKEDYTFIADNIKIAATLFDEYYYNMRDTKIDKALSKYNGFTIGDTLPLKGKTYNYPDKIDIIALTEKKVITVRQGKINAIIAVNKYIYDEDITPALMDSRGFAINVYDKKSYEKFYDEYLVDKNQADFWNKWVDCTKYRHILFNDNYWII